MRSRKLLAFAPLVALGVECLLGADFIVRTPGNQFAFQINGVDTPTLTLIRGQTYLFDVKTSVGFHPFHIYSNGVDTNDVDQGTITYRVPTNNADYFYDCSGHSGAMRGDIITVPPADFVVRTPTDVFAFRINGQDSPTLTLMRGRTYVFDVQTSAGVHAFHIESEGVDVNDVNSGRITYTVPTSDRNYYYDCASHEGLMRGQIVTLPAPTVPTLRILSLSVSSNVVLTSSASDGWTLQPEFSTNGPTTVWRPLTVQTNRFKNGTNEIICGRPFGGTVLIRLRAQPLPP